MLVIPALWRQRQEDHKVKTSLSYMSSGQLVLYSKTLVSKGGGGQAWDLRRDKMAQSVKCLVFKHKYLNSLTRTHIKKKARYGAPPCNPSTVEAETGGPAVC